MNCVIVVETDCCTNNCSKAEDRDTSVDEYEAGSSESEEEEEETKQKPSPPKEQQLSKKQQKKLAQSNKPAVFILSYFYFVAYLSYSMLTGCP